MFVAEKTLGHATVSKVKYYIEIAFQIEKLVLSEV